MVKPTLLAALKTYNSVHFDCLSSRHRNKSDIHLGLIKEAVVKQAFFQIKSLPFHFNHVKRPEDFGQEHFSLCPCHFSTHADSRTEAEWVEALKVIIGKGWVV